MAIPLAAVNDLMQFPGPCYTYVLKFPYADWRFNEIRLQRALGYPTHDILDNPDIYASMPGQSEPAEQSAFLETRGPMQAYTLLLARTAYTAAFSFFSAKQGKCPPAASIFTQCELGERDLHVHVVMGGEGLSRYNAKAIRSQLAFKWLDAIQSQLEYNLKYGHTADKVFCDVLIDCCYRAKQTCVDMKTQYCDVLQYKSRSGEMYACRVDALDYICNYLLCKNLRFFTHVDPEKATPFVAYFPCTNKTYAASFVNGKWIPIELRKQWLQYLRDSVVKKLEPVFSGDIFGDLPKVPNAKWQTDSASPSSSKPTKRETLMLDCIDRCEKNHYLTYEDLVDGCPDLVIMLESQPGGSRLIETLIQMVHIKLCQKYTALSYIRMRYEPIELIPSNKAYQLLAFQGYNPFQAFHWLCCVLNKTAGKQNTVSFFGPASTGKTNMAKSIVNAAKLYGCVNHQNKNFVFNDCASKFVCWWEECLMHSDWVEQAKCILGGTEFRIDRKHRDSMLLPQTPLIISTNNDIYTVVGGNTVSHVHAKPLKERVVQLNFMKQLQPTFGEITPEDVIALLQACIDRFPDLTLAGFCAQWNLEKVPNDFPLANLCPGHVQDFVLYEHGLCTACGGYYPLEERDRGDVEAAVTAEPAPAEFKVPGKLLLIWVLPFRVVSADTDTDSFITATPPNTPTKRRRAESTDSGPSTSTQSSPAKKPRKQKVRTKILFEDDWSAQPSDRLDRIRYERFVKSITRSPRAEDEESEPESESSEMSPAEWGEMLGLITRGLEDEPIVLHCFETLEGLEDDTDGSLQSP
ncbi:NS1 [California sea lion bocavirus 3]|uniref:Initiator protein NS1 n=1 Tax=California sea lion bocavirus 3 TaxID=1073961 RepID=G1JYX9_9VIRU|nr:NS1 [California sea lion bocavirus 3]AEM37606.1 NS1 [California sea lion bocavirus 3]